MDFLKAEIQKKRKQLEEKQLIVRSITDSTLHKHLDINLQQSASESQTGSWNTEQSL